MTLSLLLWCSLSWAGPESVPGASIPAPGGVAADPAPGVTAPAAAPKAPAELIPLPNAATTEIVWPGAAELAASMLAAVLAIGAGLHSWLLSKRIQRLEDAPRGSARPALGATRLVADPTAGADSAEPAPPTTRGLGSRGEAGSRPLQPTPREGRLPERPPAKPFEPPTPPPERRAPDEPATPPARPDPLGLARMRPAGRGSAPEPVAEPARGDPDANLSGGNESDPAERWLRSISAGRHGGIGAALGRIYIDSEEMAQKYRVAANREEFRRVATSGLKARLERLTNMRRAPSSNFRQDWVEPDLLPILDGLSNLYARALTEQRNGNAAAGQVAVQLHDALYLKLGQSCQDAGWFSIQMIIPFETDFDPIRHTAIGSADASGASSRVVDIRQAGRLDAVSGTVLAPAHVVVGE